MLDKPILAFGEVLWDVFPDGKRLGGAPLNFAYYFKKEGGNPKIVSSVGRDDLGNEAIERINRLGLDTYYIHRGDKQTGIVNVSLDSHGHEFNIRRKTAWEYISYPSQELVDNVAGIYFGTITRISRQNKMILNDLLDGLKGNIIFFDLNLRKGFYGIMDLSYLLERVNYLKMNEEEAGILKKLGLPKMVDEEEMVDYFIRQYNLEACCITLGSEGAIGGNKKGFVRVKGIPAAPGGDSVGCGDAFAATWLANLLKGKTMKESLHEANLISSKVASQRGAIVEF